MRKSSLCKRPVIRGKGGAHENGFRSSKGGCTGYLAHPFKNQQEKSCVEHVARAVEKVEMRRSWSSTASVADGGEPDLRSGEKCYRQRKLGRVMHGMCLGTQAHLRSPYRGWVFRDD